MSADQYSLASLRYDLSKLRAKALVEKLPQSRRYRLCPQGYCICLVFLKLFERIYAPLAAGLLQPYPAFFHIGHGPGGFRVWWQALNGSEETLDNAHLMRLAGRFSRRIHGYAKANGIPVVHCSAGERKHELAEEYLAKTNITQGLFLILVGRAQAPVWDVSANHHIEPKKPIPIASRYNQSRWNRSQQASHALGSRVCHCSVSIALTSRIYGFGAGSSGQHAQ